VAKRIFDAHCDSVKRIVDDGADLRQRSDQGHMDLPRLIEAGIGCQVFACFVGDIEHREHAGERARQMLEALRRLDDSELICFPETRAELEQLAEPGEQVGALLAVEGGVVLAGDHRKLEELRALGVRYITLCWGDNALGGCSFGDGRGLSGLGREVLQEMERLHILVDASHASDATLEGILEATTQPVIVSHGGARELCQSPRNLRDDQIREIAGRGGVIGVYFVSGFLSETVRLREVPHYERYMELLQSAPDEVQAYMEHADQEMARAPQAPLEAIVDHLERLIELAGIDAVGFGSDFDGFSRAPDGLRDCRDYTRVLELLRQRGRSEAELDKICWDNWARSFAWTMK